jgi:hypothetical protein
MRRMLATAALASLATAAVVVGFSGSARSADHQDAPATTADPTADINDVFTWMDGNNVVLAMTAYPNAPTGAMFSNTVQYVFHTASAITFTGSIPTTGGVDVIATFDSSTPTQNIQLWVGASEYVTGNPSAKTGLTSADGKVKVYAGLVADPFFFNLDGFKKAVSTVEAVAATAGTDGGLMFDPYGCPKLNSAQSDLLVGELGTTGGGTAVNHFATFNGLAIVVAVDKSLLTSAGAAVSVWAGTYSTATAADAGAE